MRGKRKRALRAGDEIHLPDNVVPPRNNRGLCRPVLPDVVARMYRAAVVGPLGGWAGCVRRSRFVCGGRYIVFSFVIRKSRFDRVYDKIEAPKFVYFTVPDHYRPNDRYWFCLRVGCDQKHEEEMDSEAIYNNFVLRVMAARSTNVRLRKALDRNASSVVILLLEMTAISSTMFSGTPIKCPLSALPKSSKPRLSRMAVISLISKKMAEDNKKVVRPLSKPCSTPLTKTKPIAAKYLTTPRNKKSTSDQSSFQSVQYPKPINVEVPKSRIVAKALVFRSPKKATKVKTSVELRIPVSKSCQGMNRLEISSQRKRVLGYSCNSSKKLSNSSLRRQVSSQKLQPKPEKPLQTCKVQDAKSERSTRTKIKGQLSQQKETMNCWEAMRHIA
ncbi:uncharacterized protein LOC125194788 [Salvia hispanica]|uniref:uncharacterized protein LOC125194788 n=1 Tax=Salvia hispanica TaxID=49212 RepID=UPI00200920CD|nr:uncharacterized protein LOC125194788 [Salvia hispanica]